MTNGWRNWCYVVKYDEAESACLVGGAIARIGATMEEVETACWEHFYTMFPKSFPKPKLLNLMAGMVVFQPEANSEFGWDGTLGGL